MKLLDRYILRQYIVTFLFAIIALAIVITVIHYSENIGKINNNNAELGETIIYFITFMPNIVTLMYHLFIFISTIFFTSKLAYRSEFIAMSAIGMNMKRLLRPYLIGSIIIGTCALFLNHFIIPASNKIIYDFEEKYVRATEKRTSQNVHLRVSSDTYVYVRKFSMENVTGDMFTEEVFEGNNLKQKITADYITYIDSTNQWMLKNVRIRTFDGMNEKVEKKLNLLKDYNLKPKDFSDDLQRIKTMNSIVLYDKTQIESSRGLENINAYSYEFHRRTADAFSGIILTIIAVCIASRKIRGGSGLHLAVGIILSAFFLLFVQLANTYVINSGMNALLAAWIPNFIFAIIAIGLVRWRMQ